MSTLDLTPRAGETSFEAAKANSISSAKVMIDYLNKRLSADFSLAWASFVDAIERGFPGTVKQPVVPMAYEMVFDEKGFASYAQGSMPLRSLPPMPVDKSKPAPQKPGFGHPIVPDKLDAVMAMLLQIEQKLDALLVK